MRSRGVPPATQRQLDYLASLGVKVSGPLTKAEASQKIERAKQNAILRRHGYRWQKIDEESMDYAGPQAFCEQYGDVDHVWLLLDRSGKEMNVRRAMEAIAAAGDIAAQRWLEEHT